MPIPRNLTNLLKSALWLLLLSLVARAQLPPGIQFPAASELSDQKLGSVLVYNFYTSSGTPATTNTAINLTNAHASTPVTVKLFWVNGSNGNVSNIVLHLAPKGVASLLASDVDPGVTGFIVAVAISTTTGCPISHNFLLGDADIKLAAGQRATLGAQAIAARYAGTLAGCPGPSMINLDFDGVSYNQLPRILELNNIVSTADGNSTRLVINHLGGSLAAGLTPIGNLFGLLYDDASSVVSYTLSSMTAAQLNNILSNSFPVTVPNFNTFISAGHTGWTRFYNNSLNEAYFGAALNFNPNSGTSASAMNYGNNLHVAALASAISLPMPVAVPPSPANLALTKTHSGSFTLGATGNYSITVSNAAGASAATGPITVRDSLPGNLTLSSFSGTGWSCTGTGTANVNCTHAGPVNGGTSLPVLTLTVNVASGTPLGTDSITNRATVTSALPQETVLSNNADTDPTTIGCPTITINPASLPAGTVSTPYSQNLSQTGGLGGVTWSVSAGSPPSGLTLTAAGVLSGTPTAAGTFNFTAKATDSNGCMGTRNYSLTINCPTITVNPPTLPAGTPGVIYNQTLSATGGTAPYTFTVVAGMLPNGLTLSGAGVLNGTPTLAGTFNFTVQATDVTGCSGTRTYSVAINACATISPPNQTFLTAGGSGTVAVTGPGCNWTAVSNAAWITVTGGGSGTGNGTVSYTVAANAGTLPRTGTIAIAGRRFYVNQIVAGLVMSEDFENGIPSTWTIIDGGSGGGADATWKAVSIANVCPVAPLPAPFAGMVALANGSPDCATGNSQDEQLITPAFNATGLGRIVVKFLNQFKLELGTTHVGDVEVSLDGAITWINVLHQIAPDSVTTPSLKTLDITSVIAPNPTNVRLRFHYFGPISSANRPVGGSEVIWPIDAFRITFLAINPTSQNFAASGGANSVSVTVADGEPWTAQSNVTWITGVTSGGTGSGTVNYTVAPNTAASPRTGTLTIAGNTFTVNQAAGNGLQFFPLPQPVRLLETRAGFGGCTNPGAPINANGTLTLPARMVCAGIPANAAAITGNVTVVPAGPGFLTLFPSTATQPTVANSNFVAGEITNNVFTVGLGAGDGAFKIFSSATTEVIVDVTGYYAPPGTGGLYFHPLPSPVRLLETRTIPGLLGCIKPGAPLTGGQDFAVQGRTPVVAPCNVIPAAAQMLVGNATSVFPSGAGFLTLFPSDATRPLIASSNYAGADVINGPFAVKLGTDGKFKVYTHRTTDLVIDILGYYSSEATDANGAGLLFTPLPTPVRLLETRPDFPGFPLSGCTRPNAPIVGNLNTATHTQMAANFCGLPAAAQAVVGNVSVVNTTGAGFLTLFPANLTTAPLVATSNYLAPATFGYNRHYIVGLSPTDGKFKVLTQFTTDLILDASGYFAP